MKDVLLQLIDYEFYCNSKIVDSVREANNPPQRAIELIGHILSAEEVWLSRMFENLRPVQVWQSIPLDQLRPVLERNYCSLKEFLRNMDDDKILERVRYCNSKGEEFSNTFQDIIIHISHHSAYHRGQIVQLITSQIEKPPVTDYIFWIREKQSEK